jgi:hypothetical protein
LRVEEAVDDFEGKLVTLERRHDVGARHSVPHRGQHFAGYRDSFLSRAGAATGPPHTLANRIGYLHAGDFVVKKFGVSVAGER